MFRSVTIRNFRAITDLRVDDLARVNLFVGANACGKTSLLEGIFFLIGATNPRLPVSANAFRGLPYISRVIWSTYFHNMDMAIPIKVVGELSDRKESQFLTIRPRRESVVPNDDARGGVRAAVSTSIDSEPGALVNGLELAYTSSAEPDTVVESSVFLRGEDLIVEGSKDRSIRGTFVIPTPSDWENRFSEIQRKKQVPQVIELLAGIEPNLTDLRLVHRPGLLFADVGVSELIPVNLMGGGVSTFLTVALAMLNFQDGIVLIDEIENGLHHSSQRKLWDALLAWAQKLNVQVFATTHSSECVEAFSQCTKAGLLPAEAKLFRIERKGDDFRTVEYSTQMLSESLDSHWEVR